MKNISAKRSPIRINLVEQPGWNDWDPAGELGDRASDHAWEHFTSILSEGTCDQLIMDLAGPLRESQGSKQDWSGRKITWEDTELICVALRDNPPELELTTSTIVSVLTDTYEQAMMPSDEDTRDAVDSAIEKMADNYDLDQDFWAPVLDKGADPDEIVRELFEHTVGGVFVDRQVVYERKPGHYDRYLVFDFWKSGPVKELLKSLPDDWDMRSTLLSLEKDFSAIVQAFLSRFFTALEKEMKDQDPQNRVDWRRLWKETVSGRRAPGGGAHVVGMEPTLDDVRRELRTFLDNARQESPEGESGEEES